MAEKKGVRLNTDGELRRNFMRCLLVDLQVLELMIEKGQIERGVRRIGAEQELFLVDRVLGYRKRPRIGATLVVSRRRHDL